jgi:hypothetical protein
MILMDHMPGSHRFVFNFDPRVQQYDATANGFRPLPTLKFQCDNSRTYTEREKKKKVIERIMSGRPALRNNSRYKHILSRRQLDGQEQSAQTYPMFNDALMMTAQCKKINNKIMSCSE